MSAGDKPALQVNGDEQEVWAAGTDPCAPPEVGWRDAGTPRRLLCLCKRRQNPHRLLCLCKQM